VKLDKISLYASNFNLKYYYDDPKYIVCKTNSNWGQYILSQMYPSNGDVKGNTSTQMLQLQAGLYDRL